MRITITCRDEKIAPDQAAQLAMQSIAHWNNFKGVWCPGSVIRFEGRYLSSTRKTPKSGWAISIWREPKD